MNQGKPSRPAKLLPPRLAQWLVSRQKKRHVLRSSPPKLFESLGPARRCTEVHPDFLQLNEKSAHTAKRDAREKRLGFEHSSQPRPELLSVEGDNSRVYRLSLAALPREKEKEKKENRSRTWVRDGAGDQLLTESNADGAAVWLATAGVLFCKTVLNVPYRSRGARTALLNADDRPENAR